MWIMRATIFTAIALTSDNSDDNKEGDDVVDDAHDGKSEKSNGDIVTKAGHKKVPISVTNVRTRIVTTTINIGSFLSEDLLTPPGFTVCSMHILYKMR